MLQPKHFANFSGVKKCARCGKLKELFEFYRQGDGYQSYCKECQRKYRQKHPQKEYKQNRGDSSLKLW